ncbi:MAG TPA: hypothetical protein DCF45_08315 [Gammaproteobacteria bacterium]|nr:hypothetical protein [Gammaproteobacteria bacterium]
MKAIWNGSVIAESDETIVIEGNHYFPPDSVDQRFLVASETHSHCGWKGDASYYHLQVGGEVNADAAWYYPAPYEAARQITDYLAFWNGVEVSE